MTTCAVAEGVWTTCVDLSHRAGIIPGRKLDCASPIMRAAFQKAVAGIAREFERAMKHYAPHIEGCAVCQSVFARNPLVVAMRASEHQYEAHHVRDGYTGFIAEDIFYTAMNMPCVKRKTRLTRADAFADEVCKVDFYWVGSDRNSEPIPIQFTVVSESRLKVKRQQAKKCGVVLIRVCFNRLIRLRDAGYPRREVETLMKEVRRDILAQRRMLGDKIAHIADHETWEAKFALLT